MIESNDLPDFSLHSSVFFPFLCPLSDSSTSLLRLAVFELKNFHLKEEPVILYEQYPALHIFKITSKRSFHSREKIIKCLNDGKIGFVVCVHFLQFSLSFPTILSLNLNPHGGIRPPPLIFNSCFISYLMSLTIYLYFLNWFLKAIFGPWTKKDVAAGGAAIELCSQLVVSFSNDFQLKWTKTISMITKHCSPL